MKKNYWQLEALADFQESLLSEKQGNQEKKEKQEEIDRQNAEEFIDTEIWELFRSLISKKTPAKTYTISVAFPNKSRNQENAYINTLGLRSSELNFGRVGLYHASNIAQRYGIKPEYVPESTYGSPEHIDFSIKLPRKRALK